MTMLTKANLEAGINVWKEKDWPSDLNNNLYKELQRLKSNGLNEDWWKTVVNYLSEWRAIRPKSKEFIFKRGLNRLNKLNTEYKRILDALNNHEPNLETVSWEMLLCLFAVANSIKGNNSPVFGSKLCHFIFPSAFPVIDNEVTGLRNGSYEDYWTDACTQWRNSNKQQKLIQFLKQIIGDEVYLHYPWPTKITELCFMGNKTHENAA